MFLFLYSLRLCCDLFSISFLLFVAELIRVFFWVEFKVLLVPYQVTVVVAQLLLLVFGRVLLLLLFLLRISFT